MKAIVLCSHGWNVSWLGPYGNEWVQTAALDRLAAEGIVFDNHLADRPDPALAWRSMWSGRYCLPGFDEAAESIAIASLPDQGVRTVWLRDLARPVDPALEEAWDTTIAPKWETLEGRPVALIESVEAALQELASDDQWLLWIETDRLLPPWSINDEVFAAYAQSCGPLLEDKDAPEPDEEGGSTVPHELPPDGVVTGLSYPDWLRLRSSFAAVTSQFDTELEEIIDRFRKSGRESDALWIITSTTGYPLGEHGLIGFGRPWLYEERTHLPLIMRLPDTNGAGRRVPELTQPIDILPTLLDWFGLTAIAHRHGHSLLPLMRGEGRPIRGYAVSGLDSELALQTSEWMLRAPPPPTGGEEPQPSQLFRKPDDRGEVNDLRARHLEWAEHLEERLRGFVNVAAKPGPLEPPAVKPYDEFIRQEGETT